MTIMKSNEYAILKATSINLGDKIAIVAYMYHSEKGKPKASEYRYEGRIVSLNDLKNEIAAMESDENRAKPWVWPGLEGKIVSYDGDSTQGRGARWLLFRTKKALSYSNGMKAINGIDLKSGKTSPSTAYNINGAVCADGKVLDFSSEQAFAKAGSFSKVIQRKKNAKPVSLANSSAPAFNNEAVSFVSIDAQTKPELMAAQMV